MMTTQNETLPTARKPLDLRRFLDDWVMLLAAVGIFVLCTLLIDNFLSPLNMRGLGLAISTTGIAACTMLYCLASGHFDLSVGSVIACAGVVAAVVMRDTDSVFLGVSAALAMGLIVGLINGIVIAKLRVNALITTPVRNHQDRQIATDPLVVKFLVAAGADLLVHEEVQIVDHAVLFAVGEERDIIGVEGRLAHDRDTRILVILRADLRHRRGRHGCVELPLAQREEDVSLGLIGAELARTPFLDLLFQRNRLIGAGHRANGLALHRFVRGDPGLRVGGHHHFKSEIGDREADGLGTLQRVGRRGDADVDLARHQGGDALGEGGFDDLGVDPKGFGEIVAVVDVEADRVVVGIAEAHRREVEHHRAAQGAGCDDIIQLVGQGRRRQSGSHAQGEQGKSLHSGSPVV